MGENERGEVNLSYTEADYYQAALLLSRTYPAMTAERENIRKWQTGEKKYTEDDALSDLISVTPKGDNELGVAVQTSGTSDKTASAAMKLASGFIEKRQAEIIHELFTPEMLAHIDYLDWKIDIVNTAMAERMTKLQRAIYQLLFFKGYTYSQLIAGNKGRRRLNDRKINLEKTKAVEAIAAELMNTEECHEGHLAELMDDSRKEQNL